MEYLFARVFGANKAHFKVWLTLCDIDTWPNSDATFYLFSSYRNPPAAPYITQRIP
ncbi:hypothetical protein F5888DRAFT_1950866 [Russula emetica]|nr:hypothetical protein F5888DRAFT_1950866 [Russula emetica]